jgi:hypothetical protein
LREILYRLLKKVIADIFIVTKNLSLTRSVGVICLSQYLQSNLDSLIVINNQLKPLKTTVTFGSGQLTAQMTLFTFAGTCKYCAILACHRDNSTANKRDKNPAGCASNANSLNCRAVIGKAYPYKD